MKNFIKLSLIFCFLFFIDAGSKDKTIKSVEIVDNIELFEIIMVDKTIILNNN